MRVEGGDESVEGGDESVEGGDESVEGGDESVEGAAVMGEQVRLGRAQGLMSL